MSESIIFEQYNLNLFFYEFYKMEKWGQGVISTAWDVKGSDMVILFHKLMLRSPDIMICLTKPVGMLWPEVKFDLESRC